MSEWISVKDRLPSKNESVAFTWDGQEIRTDVSYPGFNGTWECENSIGWYYAPERKITHWMPKPKKPNE